MKKINLDKIRGMLPERAIVRLTKYYNAPAIQCMVPSPYLSEVDFDRVKSEQRQGIGAENISEFFTDETGHNWLIFLKRHPFEFEGLEDADVKSFTGGAVDPSIV